MHNSPITTTFRVLNFSQSPQEVHRRAQEAIDQARLALSRGETDIAVRDLQATFGGDKRAFHEAILTLLDSDSPAGTRQAFIEQTHSRQPDFDFDAPGKDGKTVLDMAVQLKDRKLALYLLSKGATVVSAERESLLTSWRRHDLLYAHIKGNKYSWTNLDHFLYEGHYDKAQKLLTERIGGGDLNKFWEASISSGCHDVLRAILILGTPEMLQSLFKQQTRVGQWKEALRDDPGLVAVLKEFPYQSTVPENHNGKARFANTSQYILCRHLATHQQEQQARDPSGKIKFDYSQFKSPQHITENVQPEIEKTYRTLIAQAAETHLIDNAKFGQFLVKQLAVMEKENKLTRMMLIESTNHTINLTLKIKEEDGKKFYVVNFCDPNQTTENTRSMVRYLQPLKRRTIRTYIAHERLACRYYPEAKGVSMIFVRPEQNTQSGTSTPPISRANRTLASPIDPKDIDATVVWHLMRSGFDGNLKQLHEHFKTLSDSERIALLSGKYCEGSPALFMAMQEGHAEAVREYGKLLASIKNISEDDLIELITAKREDGLPALIIGIEEEHTETIREYKELWKLVSPDQQAKLLLTQISKGPYKGYDALPIALAQHKFEAAHDLLQTLARLAPQLSPEVRLFLREELPDYEDFISKIEREHRQNPSFLPPYWKIQNEVANLKKKLVELQQPAASSMQN